jgi:transposase-like protein/DNA-directed RNA polymerase subunit RPC12/RpoP
MRRIWKLPETEEKTQERPARCPRCGSKRIYRHSRLRRRVIDPKVEAVQVIRFRCEDCRKLVRVHPAGVVPQQQQSRRLQVLSALCYALGLSYDKASLVLESLGCGVVKSTIWRNVQELGEAVGKAWHPRGRRPVLGADETQLKIKGEGITVGFVTDPRSGQVVGLEVLASREAGELERWLGGLLERFGCEVVVSDELESYKGALDSLGREHQLCLAHWRKALALRLKRLPGYSREKKLLREALKELDRPALRAVRFLHRQFAQAPPPKPGEHQTPAYALRMLTLEVIENWRRLTCYQRQTKGLDNLARPVPREYEVPETNNATENSIGRAIKVRAKLTRGFKSLPGALRTTLVVAAVGNVLAGLNLQRLLG